MKFLKGKACRVLGFQKSQNRILTSFDFLYKILIHNKTSNRQCCFKLLDKIKVNAIYEKCDGTYVLQRQGKLGLL